MADELSSALNQLSKQIATVNSNVVLTNTNILVAQGQIVITQKAYRRASTLRCAIQKRAAKARGIAARHYRNRQSQPGLCEDVWQI